MQKLMCRIFDNQNHEFWQPERFGITHLWFPSGYGEVIEIVRNGRRIYCMNVYSLASLCVVS